MMYIITLPRVFTLLWSHFVFSILRRTLLFFFFFFFFFFFYLFSFVDNL
ncbi:hypothetical protein ACMBCN_03430 [Candidatus Liberibacter asiaticus]|nr:hypothetical protein [Candidatus Liberibacter asiaticus]